MSKFTSTELKALQEGIEDIKAGRFRPLEDIDKPQYIILDKDDVEALLKFVSHQYIGYTSHVKMQGIIAYAQAFATAHVFGLDELNRTGASYIGKRLRDYRPRPSKVRLSSDRGGPANFAVGQNGILKYATYHDIPTTEQAERAEGDSTHSSREAIVRRSPHKKLLRGKTRTTQKKSHK